MIAHVQHSRHAFSQVRPRFVGFTMHSARLRTIVLLSAALFAAACATGSQGSAGPRSDRSLITRSQILDTHYATAYEVVEALRSNWMNDRGADSFSNPTVVLVYLDGKRVGGTETLRTMSTASLQSIRHIDGVEASARWGLDHGKGVIYVSTTEAAIPPDMRSPDQSRQALDRPVVRAGPRWKSPASHDPSFDWFEYSGRDAALEMAATDSDHYTNPILTGFYPDPSITRRGSDYYLVTSSFSYFPGIPIFQSRDLVNWTQIGYVLDRPTQLKVDTVGVSRGVFAPTLRYHDGTFYLINTAVDAGGNFVVTATDPAGPWSDPTFLGFDGIDPDLFFDDDGRAWVMSNGPPAETPRYQGHRAIWLQEFDPRARQLIGPRSLVINGGVDLAKNPIWIEAPHLFKVNGWYYLICAEGGTADQHSEVVFRSRAVQGPYAPFEGNPILTQRHLSPSRPNPVTSTGHVDLVQTPGGEWWAVFLGTRPYRGDEYNTGRETFLLPVDWRGEWPVILRDTATVPYVVRRPSLAAQPAPPIPTRGNFTYRDDFTESSLRRDWQLLRTPREAWYSLTAPAGALTLRARPASIAQRSQPSFVARRQQHLESSATTLMRYRPTDEGDRAGLVIFQNEQFYYFLGVTRVGGRAMVQVERAAGLEPPTIVAQTPLSSAAFEFIYLRIETHGSTLDFSYALEPGNWQTLGAGLDGSLLSTHRAAGFVGAVFGLYAYTPSGP